MEKAMRDLYESGSQATLIVTPKPIHGESMMGFVLRSAEANGYLSITALFSLTGMTEKEARLARPPIAKLAPLFNRDVIEFKSLDTDAGAECGGRVQSLMHHALPSIYLRSKHARVCPDCVTESRYVSAFWELKHAVACPVHKRKSLSCCPECGTAINWYRKGLNICSCGYDFTNAKSEVVTNQAMLTLLELLYSKLMREPINQEALHYVDFPVPAMEKLSLNTLIGIISRLENFLPTKTHNDGDIEIQGIESAAEIFSSWPHGFYRYLERVHAPNAVMEAKGLRGQFKSFYESIFKNGFPREETEFLYQAFIEFGEQHWKQAAIHPRLKPNKKSNIVGIEGLAKAVGIRPSTARKLVAKGIIPIHSQNTVNGRKLFDLSQQMPFEFAQGKSLNLEAAAEIVDIPAAILRAYRSRGYYLPRHLASPIVLYHERDIQALKAELLNGCKPMEAKDELRYTTLRKVMLKKLGPSEIKAAFIDAVRKRGIRPLGLAGEQPGDLVFDARTVKDFLDGLTSKLNGTVSVEQALKELDIDGKALTAMLRDGWLKALNNEFGVRILISELNVFSGKYYSCRQLAKLKSMTQKEVLSLCHEVGIHCLSLDGESQTSSNTFIPRSQASLIGIYHTTMDDYPKAA